MKTLLRCGLAVLGLAGCYYLTVDSLKNGYSRLLSTMSVVQSRVEPADQAVSIAPKNPEAHYTRGLALVNRDRLQDAVAELRQAVQLRPHHYYQWLDLGLTLDRLDDRDGAMASFKESIRLAPGFAQPRWQLGNFLFRQGKYQEAFAELRLGAKSDPAFFNSLFDLAWVASGGDATQMEALVSPQSSTNHFALARYLADHGKASDAARHVRQAGMPQGDGDRSLARLTIAALLADKQFNDAYDAWAATHNMAGGRISEKILNGDFLEPIAPNDPGFGWQISLLPNVPVSIDTSGPGGGAQSIYLNPSGEVDPTTPLLYQFVLVQPKTHYSLNFMMKTNELVSGGPPIIAVLDASTGKTLGQSNISTGTNDWQAGQVEFLTDERTPAITVSVQRINCTEIPCPIFGKLWLSKFSLIKISS